MSCVAISHIYKDATTSFLTIRPPSIDVSSASVGMLFGCILRTTHNGNEIQLRVADAGRGVNRGIPLSQLVVREKKLGVGLNSAG